MRRDAMDLYIAASTNCSKEYIGDRRLLSLLRAFLRAGVMEQGTVRRPVTGTAQGAVISADFHAGRSAQPVS